MAWLVQASCRARAKNLLVRFDLPAEEGGASPPNVASECLRLHDCRSGGRMTGPPTGTVTFLSTTIKGCVPLSQRVGQPVRTLNLESPVLNVSAKSYMQTSECSMN
jgi:hypothetical protein